MTRLSNENTPPHGDTVGARNLTVVARNSTDGFYYRGYITNAVVPEEDCHRVRFYNIVPQNVPTNHVISFGGAIPWPELRVGDFVLVEVRCKTSGLECFMPGRVWCIPLGVTHEQRFYTVKLYVGRLTNKRRRFILKIGPERYREILEYISNIRYRQPIRFVSEPDLYRQRLVTRSQMQKQRILLPGKKRVSSSRSVSSTGSSSTGRKRHPEKVQSKKYLTVNKGIQTETRSSSMTLIRELTESVSTLSRYSSSRTSRTSSSRSYRSQSSRSSTGSKSIRSSRDRTTPSSRKLGATPLPEGREVLARWADDGWYYFGEIVTDEDTEYIVRDATGHMEPIRRENILTEEENSFEAIQPHDHVVALHPRYVYSYAPATVREVYNFGVKVHFYDDMERKLPWSEVYKISPVKYKESVDYIKEREEKICGRVVARDDVTGLYRPYFAESPDHQTQQYFLQMPNNTYKKQYAIHVFPMNEPARSRDRDCRYVLGPLDQAETVYLPAQVSCRHPLKLTFCNGTQSDQVTLHQCFYINEDYFNNASNYFMNNYRVNA